MTIRTVLLHAASETLDPATSASRYALELARTFDAHLAALVLELNAAMPKGFADNHAAEAGGRRRNSNVQIAADALREAASDHGVTTSVITDRSHVHSTPEIAADYARLADLVVAGTCDEGLLSERIVAEALVFQSGRPIIIVPDDHDGGFAADRILVAWDYTRIAARALSDAMPFLRRASEVTLVCFGDDKDFSTSLSQEDVLVALRHRGVEARFEQLERRSRDIGLAICDAATERQADLLVMGASGQSRARSFVLGGATRGIMADPKFPTLISH